MLIKFSSKYKLFPSQICALCAIWSIIWANCDWIKVNDYIMIFSADSLTTELSWSAMTVKEIRVAALLHDSRMCIPVSSLSTVSHRAQNKSKKVLRSALLYAKWCLWIEDVNYSEKIELWFRPSRTILLGGVTSVLWRPESHEVRIITVWQYFVEILKIGSFFGVFAQIFFVHVCILENLLAL